MRITKYDDFNMNLIPRLSHALMLPALAYMTDEMQI